MCFSSNSSGSGTAGLFLTKLSGMVGPDPEKDIGYRAPQNSTPGASRGHFWGLALHKVFQGAGIRGWTINVKLSMEVHIIRETLI